MAERHRGEHATGGSKVGPPRRAGSITKEQAAPEFGAIVLESAGRRQSGEIMAIGEAVDNAIALLGGREIIGSSIESDMDAHEVLRRGLPRESLSKLVDNLHVIGVDEASEALGVSVRTLQRHKHAPVAQLSVEQSGRTWKFAEILAKATAVFGSQDEAEQWLRRPAIGLDQRRPLDLLTTPAGVRLVEDYLGRIEYGVYT